MASDATPPVMVSSDDSASAPPVYQRIAYYLLGSRLSPRWGGWVEKDVSSPGWPYRYVFFRSIGTVGILAAISLATGNLSRPIVEGLLLGAVLLNVIFFLFPNGSHWLRAGTLARQKREEIRWIPRKESLRQAIALTTVGWCCAIASLVLASKPYPIDLLAGILAVVSIVVGLFCAIQNKSVSLIWRLAIGNVTVGAVAFIQSVV